MPISAHSFLLNLRLIRHQTAHIHSKAIDQARLGVLRVDVIRSKIAAPGAAGDAASFHMGCAPRGKIGFTRNLSASGDVWWTRRELRWGSGGNVAPERTFRSVPWEETLDLFLREVDRTPFSGASKIRAYMKPQ
jgi:hypothetical protein